jgi:hypothetical protein
MPFEAAIILLVFQLSRLSGPSGADARPAQHLVTLAGALGPASEQNTASPTWKKA